MMAGIMVVLIWLVLLLLQSGMTAAAEEDDDDASSHCFAEPVGIGACGLDTNATAEPPNVTYFTARFGIPTNKKSGNGTTAVGDSGVPRVKYCRYAWQVIQNDQGSLSGLTFFAYTWLDSSDLTASDPNCTDNCSAVISSQSGMVFTLPKTLTICHRFYMLPILEGQEKSEAATMEWNPFPMDPSEDQPPKSGTLQVTADGCTYDEWDPVPTSTPSSTPPPTSSSGGRVTTTTASCWMWITVAAFVVASRVSSPVSLILVMATIAL
jgi:hypothetical protein